MLRGYFILLAVWAALCSCGVVARGRQIARAVEGSSVFSKGITGFVLLDAQTGRKIADVYGNRYFTPASNVKILTLAASLSLLPDTLPTLQIRPWEGPFTQGQSRLLIRGTETLHSFIRDLRLGRGLFTFCANNQDLFGCIGPLSKSSVSVPAGRGMIMRWTFKPSAVFCPCMGI